MKPIAKIFFLGMLISFLGSLPPGTMNIVSVHITTGQGNKAALIYALGSMLVEVIVVRLALVSIKYILRLSRLFMLLELFTASMLLLITIGCFSAAGLKNDASQILPHYILSPFLTGVVLSATNPLHIPFWLGWTTVLLNKKLLKPQVLEYNGFVCGIGVGTMLGFVTYMLGGRYLLTVFETNQFVIYIGTGICLLFTLILHVKKMIMAPASLRYAALINCS